MKTNLKEKTQETGIFDLDEKTYRAMEAVNRSLIEVLHNNSPEHAKYFLDNPPESTPSMALGICTHTACLEPQKFAETVAVVPARSAKNKELHVGKTLLLESEVEIVDGIKKSLATNKINFDGQLITPADLIKRCKVERSIVWRDGVSEILCKAKLDLVYKDEIVIDFKTTTSIQQFLKDAYKYGVGRQGAFYTQGLSLATNCTASDFYLLVAEKEPPFSIAVFQCSDVFLERGAQETRAALTTLAECMRTDVWPGYPNYVQVLDLPYWVR